MKKYTVSFIFNESLSDVLLIRKTHPPRFAGKLNGVGGAFEDKDKDDRQSALREIAEESDLKEEDLSDFYQIGTVTGVQAFVSFWVGIVAPTATPQSNTDEKVSWYDVKTFKNEALVENVDTIVDFSIKELTKRKEGKTTKLAQINLVYPYDLV